MATSLADLQFLGFMLSCFHSAAENYNRGRHVRNHGRDCIYYIGLARAEVVLFPLNHFSARAYNFDRNFDVRDALSVTPLLLKCNRQGHYIDIDI